MHDWLQPTSWEALFGRKAASRPKVLMPTRKIPSVISTQHKGAPKNRCKWKEWTAVVEGTIKDVKQFQPNIARYGRRRFIREHWFPCRGAVAEDHWDVQDRVNPKGWELIHGLVFQNCGRRLRRQQPSLQSSTLGMTTASGPFHPICFVSISTEDLLIDKYDLTQNTHLWEVLKYFSFIKRSSPGVLTGKAVQTLGDVLPFLACSRNS